MLFLVNDEECAHPNAHKVDLDVAREAPLERLPWRLLPGTLWHLLVLFVDAVGQGDRLFVSGGEQADLLYHSGQRARRKRAAREAEAARGNVLSQNNHSRALTTCTHRKISSPGCQYCVGGIEAGQSAFRRQTRRATHIHQKLVTALDVLPRDNVVSILLSRDGRKIRTYGREGPSEPIVENGGDASTSTTQEPRKAGRLDDRRPDSRLVVQQLLLRKRRGEREQCREVGDLQAFPTREFESWVISCMNELR